MGWYKAMVYSASKTEITPPRGCATLLAGVGRGSGDVRRNISQAVVGTDLHCPNHLQCSARAVVAVLLLAGTRIQQGGSSGKTPPQKTHTHTLWLFYSSTATLLSCTWAWLQTAGVGGEANSFSISSSPMAFPTMLQGDVKSGALWGIRWWPGHS